jgi:transposase, IS5 family
MSPQKMRQDSQKDLFKVELKTIVDSRHPLVKLANQMNWQAFDEHFESYFSDEGRPAIATRLMVSLHYLKYTYNLSDAETLERWVENAYWQHFSGQQYFEYKLPIDPSSMTRWRQRIGEEGAEKLLSQTITTALKQGDLKPSQCHRVNVDTTVQTKNIRFPTDARLYDRMRETLVRTAESEDIPLRQSYKRVGKKILRKQQGYTHAKQGRRARGQTKQLNTILGRVTRDIERKAVEPSAVLKEHLSLAKQLKEQKRDSKNKVYSVHEPQVQCIAKGKAHQRYEFGCKVGLITTAKGNWILGAKAFPGNPYDGHTLKKSLEQAKRLSSKAIQQGTCDLGYRGHEVKDTKVLIVPRKKKHAKASLRYWWKRRNAIEPIIGHQKSDHRLSRNQLSGELGDQMNVILAACGYNLKKLIRAFWLWIQWAFPMNLRINYQRTFA